MRRWHLMRGGLAAVTTLALSCNANPLGDRTCADPADCPDTSCSDPNDCPGGGAISTLLVTPSPVTLLSQDGSQPTQQFTVTGQRSDGSSAGPVRAKFSAPSNGIGIIDPITGLFTATGEVAGTLTLTATVKTNSGPLSANFLVTVKIARSELAPGTPAGADGHFGGTPVADAGQAAGIVYPLDGVVMPQNVYPADIQWTLGSDGDYYRVTLTKPHITVTAYTWHKGADFHFDYLPTGKGWSGIAQSDPDDDAVLTVDRWDHASSVVYSGTPVKMHFAKGSLLGSIYYWDIGAGRIRRIDDGSANRVDFMPTPPTSPVDSSNCVGCHGVSRDGRYLLGRLGGGSNVAGVFDLTKDLSVSPAPSEYPISAGLPQFMIASWKPDNSRLIANTAGRDLILVDAKSGQQVAPVAGTLPANSVYPNWSPDGNTIAYVSSAPDWGGELNAGDLSILPVTGADSFGPPQLIHSASSIPGATADTWPSWSPDSKWIAFQSGTDSRSDDGKPGALYLINPSGGGLVRLTNATGGNSGSETVFVPNFSPFNVGGYYWLTFISRRPYGNAQVGTAATQNQQLWVAAVKNLPLPGQDPSCVPYWLPGQATAAKNISAFWAPKACRKDGESCTVGAECCSTVCAMGTCQVPPPEHCRQRNETCGGDGDCCGGFSCNPTTHICEGEIG